MKRKPKFEDWRDALLAEVWDASIDLWQWTWKELAEEADLATATVYRLRSGQTKEPRMRTIYKLATAVGMDLKLIEKIKRKAARRAA